MQEYDAAGFARLLGRRRETPIGGRATPTFKTFCPAHDDKISPSMLVADGFKTVVFHCYAGCSQTQIMDALRDKYSAVPKLFNDSAPRTRSDRTPAAASEVKVVEEPAEKWIWSKCGLPSPPQAWEITQPPGRWKENGRWAWRSATGEILMWNVRLDSLDHPGEKTFVPMSVWEQEGVGKRQWLNKAVGTPRILYDLHLQDSAADILVLEGEKTVETAKKWFGRGFWCTTCGASHSVMRSDLSPMIGRRVVVATDMDGPGLAYASALADYAPAASVEVLRIPEMFSPKEGDDLFDLAAAGVTATDFIAAVRDSRTEALVKLR